MSEALLLQVPDSLPNLAEFATDSTALVSEQPAFDATNQQNTGDVLLVGGGLVGLSIILFGIERAVAKRRDPQHNPDSITARNTSLMRISNWGKDELSEILEEDGRIEQTHGPKQRHSVSGFLHRHIGVGN